MEPPAGRFEIEVERFRCTGQRNSAIDLKELRIGLFNARKNLGSRFPGDIWSSDDPNERRVDIEIDVIYRMSLVVKEHPAVRKPFQKIFKNGMIVLRAFLNCRSR